MRVCAHALSYARAFVRVYTFPTFSAYLLFFLLQRVGEIFRKQGEEIRRESDALTAPSGIDTSASTFNHANVRTGCNEGLYHLQKLSSHPLV